MAANENAPAVCGSRGAEKITFHSRKQLHLSTARTLELIVVDRRKAVCQIDVQAEHRAGGWYVPAQWIPAAVLR